MSNLYNVQVYFAHGSGGYKVQTELHYHPCECHLTVLQVGGKTEGNQLYAEGINVPVMIIKLAL